MSKLFDEHYEYLLNYINCAIQKEHLSPSVILEGSDILAQYSFAMEIARRLNCLEDGRSDCSCRNCNWVRLNTHPAVMTVSKVDNKNDESKTVISEEQVSSVLDNLMHPSDFHKVFIFCDANLKKLTSLEQKRYEHFKSSGLNPPQEGSEKAMWYPSGLNFDCFTSVAANSMLKSIEEPPERVTFIFLTENRNDLISTIISRSQTFIVPSLESEKYDFSFFSDILKNYPEFKLEDAIPFAYKLSQYQKESGYTTNYILDCLQQYIKELIKSNVSNSQFLQKAYKDIEKIEESKKMSEAYIKENIVYENLAFYFAG